MARRKQIKSSVEFMKRFLGLKSYVAAVQNEFVRNVIILFSGTALAQLIMVAAAPILSRLYTPEDFGAFAVFASIFGFLAVISTLKYELAIVLPKSDEDACGLLVLCLSLTGGISLVSGAIAALSVEFLDLQILNISAPLLGLCAGIFVFLGGSLMVFQFWAIRSGKFSSLSVSELVQSGVTIAGQISLSALGWGATGLMLGRLMGVLGGGGVVARHLCAAHVRRLMAHIRTRDLVRLAREHAKFPKYSLPKVALNEVSSNSFVVFLALVFGPEMAGLYWLAQRVLSQPISLIGRSIRRVFYQRVAESYNADRPIVGIYSKVTLALLALSAPPALIILFFGPDIFEFVFGDQWRGAGVFSQWLTLGWVGLFVVGPSSMLVPVLGLQREVLFLDLVVFCFQVVVILIANGIRDEIVAVAGYSLVGLVGHLMLIWMVSRRTAQYENGISSPLGMTTP